MRTSGELRLERCSAKSWRLFSERSCSSRARRSAGINRSPIRGAVICRWSRGSVATRAAAPARSTGLLALLSLADAKDTAFEVFAIQLLHGAGRIGIGHLDNVETACAARVDIHSHPTRLFPI